MSTQPYHRYADPRGRRQPASDGDSLYSDSPSIVEKYDRRQPRPDHRDASRGRRRDSSRRRHGGDDSHVHNQHPNRHHQGDRGDSLDKHSGAIVQREEFYAVQHIPRDSSVASSAAQTCVYDHRNSRDRRHRSRSRYYDDRNRSSDGRHRRERSKLDPRVILAALLFAATAALCYKDMRGGGKKRGGGRKGHGGRPA